MEYPIVTPGNGGLVVQMSKGMRLPGIFLNYMEAERAIAKYRGRQVEVTRERKAKLQNKKK